MMQAAYLAFILGFMLLLSCKQRSSETASVNLTEAQRLFVDDLKRLDEDPSDLPLMPMSEEDGQAQAGVYLDSDAGGSGTAPPKEGEIRYYYSQKRAGDLIKHFKFEADGMISLAFGPYVLRLNANPGDAEIKKYQKFTDFFTALNRALANAKTELEGGKPSIAVNMPLAQLYDAYKAGEFDRDNKTFREQKSKGYKIKAPLKTSSSAKPAYFYIGFLPYEHVMKRYLIAGLENLATDVSIAAAKSKVPASISPSCSQRKKLLAASFVPFKFGEVARGCAAFIDQSIARGFSRVAFFPAVHYAGGKDDSISELEGNLFEKPRPKVDYRIMQLMGTGPQEVSSCVEQILAAGLELTYIPHLEAVRTMISKGEAEWRIDAPVPLDDADFYRLGYQPAVDAMKRVASTGKIPRVTFSIAGEVENSVLKYPDAALRLAQRIRKDAGPYATQLLLSFSPNGDSWSLTCDAKAVHKKRGIDGCKEIKDLFLKELDVVGGSLYDSYNHIFPESSSKATSREKKPPQCVNGIRAESSGPLPSAIPSTPGAGLVQTAGYSVPSAARTFDALALIWSTELENLCGIGSQVASRFKGRVGSSEFSLQGPRSVFYGKFFEEALQLNASGSIQINLWNSGQAEFDPFASDSGDIKNNSENAKRVLDYLKCQ